MPATGCAQMGLSLHEILYRRLSSEENARLHATVNKTIAEHFGAFLRISAKDMLNVWAGPDKEILGALGLPHISFGILREVRQDRPGMIASWLVIATSMIWLLVIYATMARTLYQRLRGRPLPAIAYLGLLAGLYILATASGPMGDPRLRAPAMAPLMLFGAACLDRRQAAQKVVELHPASAVVAA